MVMEWLSVAKHGIGWPNCHRCLFWLFGIFCRSIQCMTSRNRGEHKSQFELSLVQFSPSLLSFMIKIQILFLDKLATSYHLLQACTNSTKYNQQFLSESDAQVWSVIQSRNYELLRGCLVFAAYLFLIIFY